MAGEIKRVELRLPVELHTRLVTAAEIADVSLNALVEGMCAAVVASVETGDAKVLRTGVRVVLPEPKR